ncbi:AAA family ATPase [Marinicellulosiphila megalodicopiae]|uniref:AAA family ATPase n=1 Tax=Marinicellulosiphila megalodicopiae TaxID=2724896 RepID=UPI003BB05E3E
MSFSLKIINNYKSISAINSPELPDFTILTGKNGQGKTHVLEGINNKIKTSDDDGFENSEVRYYSFLDLRPPTDKAFDFHAYMGRLIKTFQRLKQLKKQALDKCRSRDINHYNIPIKHFESFSEFCKINSEDLEKCLPVHITLNIALEKIQILKASIEKSVTLKLMQLEGNHNSLENIQPLLECYPQLLLIENERDFLINPIILFGEVDLFNLNLSKIFGTYRYIIKGNSNYEMGSEISPPPWDSINKLLLDCNLDFKFNPPNLEEISEIDISLKHKNGSLIKFSDLSSGEKILISFAILTYNILEKNLAPVIPNIILFDEIDATLHPSMINKLITLIEGYIVKNGVRVIMTTHNPTTVALSPESSIHILEATEINESGYSHLIEQVSKDKAISLLTAGIPTLAINTNQRCNVFVESIFDSQLYNKLFNIYKNELDHPGSLNFISVGFKHSEKATIQNGGCNQVRKIVSDFYENDNYQIKGLIDGDNGDNKSVNNIFILSEKRKALESLILDPLLLALGIIKKGSDHHFGILGLSDYTFTKITLEQDNTFWIEPIKKLQYHLLGKGIDKNGSTTIEYLNGYKLEVFNDFLSHNEHDLVKKINEKFGFLKFCDKDLKNKKQNDTEIMDYIESILKEQYGFIPLELIETFNKILEN